MRRTYEICDVDTQEILMDNLTFSEAIEQSKIYMETFGDGISVAIRESCYMCKHKSKAKAYKEAWIEYFGELQLMGNLN